MADLIDLSLGQMRQSLLGGEFSSQELTRAFIERIERLEPGLHAFITLTPELALGQAALADHCLADWRRNPDAPLPALMRIPLAVKDILSVSGVRCTCGSHMLENFIPPYTATAVERLLNAGAVLLAMDPGVTPLAFWLAVTACAIAIVSPAPVAAQSSTGGLKDRLVGAWTQESIVLEQSGRRIEPYGPAPRGYLSFHPDGHFSSMIIRSDLPRIASNNRVDATPEEMKAVYLGSICYFGKYTVDEASGTLTLHVDKSSYNYNGTDEKRLVTISGDELRLTNPNPFMGGTAYFPPYPENTLSANFPSSRLYAKV